MKGFYNTWNKDNIEDEIILKQIKEELSDNQLDIDIEKVKEYGLFNNNVKKDVIRIITTIRIEEEVTIKDAETKCLNSLLRVVPH